MFSAIDIARRMGAERFMEKINMPLQDGRKFSDLKGEDRRTAVAEFEDYLRRQDA